MKHSQSPQTKGKLNTLLRQYAEYNKTSTEADGLICSYMSKDFSAMLKENGLKNTPARWAILDVFSADRRPINADHIREKLKKRDVNLVTIYRTLASFEAADIIRRLDIHKESAYYELALDHHHHIVCTECGMIEDFEGCDVENATRGILKHSTFQSINTHSLELFGVCKRCAHARP